MNHKTSLILSLLLLICGSAVAQNSFEIGMPFTKISLRGAIIAELIPSDKPSATITLNGIEQNRVEWNVKNECLNISLRVGVLDKDCSANVKIYYSTLNYIGIEGTTITSADPLSAERLKIETLGGSNKLVLNVLTTDLDVIATGNCSIKLSGTSTNAVIKAYMGAKVDCMSCVIDNVFATVKQRAELYVKCDGVLDAKVNAGGNLFYLGTPRLNAKATLGGAVIGVDSTRVDR